MVEIIRKNIQPVRKLCKGHRVARLYVFGSSLTKKFKKDSDVDLVVDFKNISKEKYADNYFEFKYGLEKILKRDVDLLEEKAIRNPFIKESINSNKQLVYAEKN